MTRQKSAILSPADKKAKIAELKLLLKNAKADVKTNADAQKKLDKQYAADSKAISKTAGTAAKALAKVEAELAALTS